MSKLIFFLIFMSLKTGSAQFIPIGFWKSKLSAGGGFISQNFAASGTYVVPASGCTNMVVQVWGGGGGGGGGYFGHTGTRGGTGDYRSGTIIVTPGETLSVYIGLKGRGGANSDVFPALGGAGGTTTGTGSGAFGGNASASGGGGGGGGGASSIVNAGTTILVLSGGGGGGAGGSVNSGTVPINVGGSAPSGAGLNDSGTYENCATYGGAPANCAANRVAASTADGTAGTLGNTGGGGGGGGGGSTSGLGGTGGRGGTHYGAPYRSGGGDAGSSLGLGSSVNTTYGTNGIGDAYGAGTDGTNGYISLVSCS